MMFSRLCPPSTDIRGSDWVVKPSSTPTLSPCPRAPGSVEETTEPTMARTNFFYSLVSTHCSGLDRLLISTLVHIRVSSQARSVVSWRCQNFGGSDLRVKEFVAVALCYVPCVRLRLWTEGFIESRSLWYWYTSIFPTKRRA